AAGAHGGDVGDAGPEGAAHAEDLLVDLVGDLVGDVAHGGGPAVHGQAHQPLLPGDIEQLELDPVAAVRRVQHPADHQEVLLQQPPGGEIDVGAARRALDHVLVRQGA